VRMAMCRQAVAGVRVQAAGQRVAPGVVGGHCMERCCQRIEDAAWNRDGCEPQGYFAHWPAAQIKLCYLLQTILPSRPPPPPTVKAILLQATAGPAAGAWRLLLV
jgi:hypothetical protein